MYRTIRAVAIIATTARLVDRVRERFPESGLLKVSEEILSVARESGAALASSAFDRNFTYATTPRLTTTPSTIQVGRMQASGRARARRTASGRVPSTQTLLRVGVNASGFRHWPALVTRPDAELDQAAGPASAVRTT